MNRDPRIIFGDERNNGLGTVTIHYGLETLEDRIADFVEHDGWNGYLFRGQRPKRAT